MTHQFPIHQGQSISLQSCLSFSIHTHICNYGVRLNLHKNRSYNRLYNGLQAFKMVADMHKNIHINKTKRYEQLHVCEKRTETGLEINYSKRRS